MVTKKRKCHVCNKKLPGMSYYTCKCAGDKFYCGVHRYPDGHDCTFDHAEHDKQILKLNNPSIIPTKIDKL